MELKTARVHRGGSWDDRLPDLDSPQTLVLAFAAAEFRDEPGLLKELAATYPHAVVMGCSTGGEIHGESLHEDALVTAVARFDHTRLTSACAEVDHPGASFDAGRALAEDLMAPDLRAVFVLSDGTSVNGSELARGLRHELDDDVVVTGGLAGDGDRFEQTWVLCGDEMREQFVSAVGLYGPRVAVGHGSRGGWDPFGPERIVTRSDGHILHELDGEPALDLYKRYLGDLASGLPASALLFPLALRPPEGEAAALVRTVLGVDEDDRSMTFAGDLPEGWRVQLMQANFDRLVDGAEGAADAAALEGTADVTGDQLTLAISCVGRRLVLGERVEEELEAVSARANDAAGIVGFYSYGEISPLVDGGCELHNQTMTLTTIAER